MKKSCMTTLEEVQAIAKAEDMNQVVGYVGYLGCEDETDFQKNYPFEGMDDVGWYIVNSKTESVEYISLCSSDCSAIDNPYTSMSRIARILKELGFNEMPTDNGKAYQKLLTAVTSQPCR